MKTKYYVGWEKGYYKSGVEEVMAENREEAQKIVMGKIDELDSELRVSDMAHNFYEVWQDRETLDQKEEQRMFDLSQKLDRMREEVDNG